MQQKVHVFRRAAFRSDKLLQRIHGRLRRARDLESKTQPAQAIASRSIPTLGHSPLREPPSTAVSIGYPPLPLDPPMKSNAPEQPNGQQRNVGNTSTCPSEWYTRPHTLNSEMPLTMCSIVHSSVARRRSRGSSGRTSTRSITLPFESRWKSHQPTEEARTQHHSKHDVQIAKL